MPGGEAGLGGPSPKRHARCPGLTQCADSPSEGASCPAQGWGLPSTAMSPDTIREAGMGQHGHRKQSVVTAEGHSQPFPIGTLHSSVEGASPQASASAHTSSLPRMPCPLLSGHMLGSLLQEALGTSPAHPITGSLNQSHRGQHILRATRSQARCLFG